MQMSEDNHVQVIIAGSPGSGKTTVANIVCAALREAGLEKVFLADDFAPGEPQLPLPKDALDICSRAMVKNETTIHVQTRQIRFQPYTKQS